MKLHYELQRSNNAFLSDCIREYEDIIPEVLCDELIEFFESSLTFSTDLPHKQCREMQIVGDPRPEAVQYKNLLFDYLYPLGIRYENEVNDFSHDDYKVKGPTFTEHFNTGFRSLQIQKYTPNDKGYPTVHVEQGPDHVKKYLAAIIYLNEVDGGETVFPMGGTAISPSTGNAVIWPSGFPFWHCGNKSKSDKYILTTWFEFI